MGSVTPAAFAPRPDDDDDVRWALSTALVQWNRGGRADAVVWLRRAGEAAEASGAPARASELRRHAATLAETLWSQPPPDDIEVEVDGGEQDRRAPLPPPPGAVRAIQERARRAGPPSVPPVPSVPPLVPHQAPRKSITEMARESFASAPEIILDEESLDASELEEILDYVGEDELDLVGELERPSADGIAARAGAAGEAFAGDSALPPRLEADTDSDFDLERQSETEVIPLRPSADPTPSERPPAVALPLDDEGEDFDDRVTVVPHSADAEAVRAASVRSMPPVGVASGRDRRSSEPMELLDGEAALAIDADLRHPYEPESIDLGADWAPVDSDRGQRSAPPGAEFESDEAFGSVVVEPEAPNALDVESGPASAQPEARGVLETLSEEDLTLLEPLPDEEGLAEAEAPASAELIPISFDEEDGGRLSTPDVGEASGPESLPPLDFASEPPLPPTAPPPPGGVDEALLALASRDSDRVTALSELREERDSERVTALTELREERDSDRVTALSELREERDSERVTALPELLVARDSDRPTTPSQREPLSESVQGTVVDGVDLSTTRGFEDLPEEVQLALAQSVRLETLAEAEEVGLFGAAIITHGQVNVMPAFADESGAVAMQSDVVFTRGSLEDSIALRVVAKVDGTRVAVWDPKPFADAIEACPWVHEELRMIADRFLALCGATLGPLGERLDESLRAAVFQRLEVKAFSVGEELTTKGAPLPGLFVIGGGRVEILDGEQVVEVKSPGDFLFAMAIMGGAKSPATARAAEQGALALFAPRAVAHELMISVPPLLEVLAG